MIHVSKNGSLKACLSKGGTVPEPITGLKCYRLGYIQSAVQAVNEGAVLSKKMIEVITDHIDYGFRYYPDLP